MTEILWETPKSWQWARIDQVGEVVSGATPSTKVSEYWGSDVVWFSPADLTGYRSKYIAKGAKSISFEGLANSSARIFPAGSVMFSSRAPVGYVAINTEKAATNQGFKTLVPGTGLIAEFVYYYFKAIRHIAEQRATGTTFKELSGSAFAALPIVLPPTNEQRRIVQKIEAMFEQIDKGVESLAVAKTTLGLYRQSLLKSAFEGRLTAAWRSQNPDKLEPPKALLARIQKERETRYKSALDDWQTALSEWRAGGEVGRKPGKPSRPDWPAGFDFHDLKALPDGWLYLPFEALAWSIRNGISAKPDGQGPLKIFRISAVRARAFDLEDFRRITDTDGSMSAYRLSYGDLVFTRYNGSRDYVGVSAMYRGDGSHVYPDKLIRCEFKSDLLNPAYLELATNCGESRAHLERLIRTTAGQSGISGGDIKSMPVPICSPAEQAEITRLLDARLAAADAMEAEINAALSRAEALRQSILKQAFAGTLVPQDPTDEPAPTLLARIKAERAKAGKSKPARKVSA